MEGRRKGREDGERKRGVWKRVEGGDEGRERKGILGVDPTKFGRKLTPRTMT